MTSPANLVEKELAKGAIPSGSYEVVSKLTEPVGPVKPTEPVKPSLIDLMAAFLGLPPGTDNEALARHIATRLQEPVQRILLDGEEPKKPG